jgi:hypothetical protein
VKRSGSFVGVLSKNEFGKAWRRNEFFWVVYGGGRA